MVGTHSCARLLSLFVQMFGKSCLSRILKSTALKNTNQPKEVTETAQ